METQGLLASPVIHKIGWNPMKMRNTLRSPIKSHGGKFYLSEAILTVCAPAMSACPVWLEPCAGGANTALQATPRPGVVQIVSDSDPLIANVWRVFSTPALALRVLAMLQSVDVTTREGMEREWQAATTVIQMAHVFDGAKAVAESFESWGESARVSLATAAIVNSRMSRGGMGKSFAWQKRPRGGQPGEINSWKTFVWNHAPRVVSRCGNFFAMQGDALTLLNPETSPDGGASNPGHFYYFDPPYVKETRTVKDVYWEDGFDHEAFMRLVVGARAKVAISGYNNNLYTVSLDAKAGWQRHDFHIVNHSGQNVKKADRVESLWTNF